MNCPYNIKICNKCKRILIACEINFKKEKRGKYGLYSRCKECDKKYREEHKEYYSEYRKQWREKNSEYNKQYYENNKEEIKEQSRQYKEEHKEYYSEYQKQYNINNPHIKFNASNKRRQIKENQGRGITSEQWLEMMLFFDFRCAYSDEYIGGDNKHRTIDHIVALNNGGLNEIWNCVPMYKAYNISKHTKDMLDWYTKQSFYSEERLEKIYAWIEYAYEKWGYKRRKGNKKIGNF